MIFEQLRKRRTSVESNAVQLVITAFTSYGAQSLSVKAPRELPDLENTRICER